MKALLILLIITLACTCSCARYRASALTTLSTQDYGPSGVFASAHPLNRRECRKYLGRDLLKKGYQPVQISIENRSEHTYLFSPNRVGLPLADPQEVAKQMHTSTFGRILGYTVGGTLLSGLTIIPLSVLGAAFTGAPLLTLPLCLVCAPFYVPAAYDGVKSAKANAALDRDYVRKGAKEQAIAPYSHLNLLLFVPEEEFQESFTFTLLEEETNKPKRLFIKTSR